MSRDAPVTVLDYELQEEKASALGRAGRRLEAALAALERAHQPAPEVLAEARDALWCYIVQRDVLGLSTDAAFLAAYRVPQSVHMGIAVERVAPRRRWRGP
jgi:hypothetical protein